MRLEGAVCLVTGASSGIGRATATALRAAGADVVALGRDEAALASLGGRRIVCDLADAGEVERAAVEAGAVDVLVANAGIGRAGPFAELEPETAERLLRVNLLAPLLLARALVPGMLERGRGHVVVVGSIVGHVGAREEAAYAATKGGLVAFAASLRQELAGGPVGVSLVTPGVVATPFFDRRGRPYERAFPRPLPPERVAAAIVDAVEHDRAEVFVPRWLALPARLRAVAPGLYRALAARFD
ncbi:MAG TPA: SDR family NAD(P)-dependent oxidoreductase [Gaiellaceae bacterium]|nr:SDR family NAD(P)-dependent oxidoreductase [Gaiellaceae bacterium]